MRSIRLYRILLRLYPYDYRVMFGPEVLELAARRPMRIELAGLLAGAVTEWLAKWTTDPAVRGRCLPDVRMMRPVGVTREAWFATPPQDRSACS